MNHAIGKCSLCGGTVAGHSGPCLGTIPPDPAKCLSCGAVEKCRVIEMEPSPGVKPAITTGYDTSVLNYSVVPAPRGITFWL